MAQRLGLLLRSNLFHRRRILHFDLIAPAAGRGVYPVQKDRRVASLGAFVRLRSRLLAHSEVLDFRTGRTPGCWV